MAKSNSKSGSRSGSSSGSSASKKGGSGPSLGSTSSVSKSSNNSRSRASASRGSNTRSSSSNGRSSNGSTAGRQENEGLMKLFTEQLQDVYYVEKQLVRGLTRMAKTAQSDDLRQAFEQHRDETETQMERLEEIFEMLDRNPKARKCEAMDGLMDEAKELMEDFSDDPALDAALVAAAQKVEHYEIATYGSLRAWAEQLGLEEAVPLLEETLAEEKQTDENLTELAVTMLNEQGEEGGSQNGEMLTASGGSSGSKRSRR